MKNYYLFARHGRNIHLVKDTVRIFEDKNEMMKHAKACLNKWFIEPNKTVYAYDGIYGAIINESGQKSIRNFAKLVESYT